MKKMIELVKFKASVRIVVDEKSSVEGKNFDIEADYDFRILLINKKGQKVLTEVPFENILWMIPYVESSDTSKRDSAASGTAKKKRDSEGAQSLAV
jgi:hypothetical protein